MTGLKLQHRSSNTYLKLLGSWYGYTQDLMSVLVVNDSDWQEKIHLPIEFNDMLIIRGIDEEVIINVYDIWVMQNEWVCMSYMQNQY
jgi:hypothetical protein